MAYITEHKARLERRHYITNARTDTRWFNFSKGKLEEFISTYGLDFSLIINGSTTKDDAYILPFKDFRDFFTPEFLDKRGRRWSGYIHAGDEAIRLSPCRKGHERLAQDYYNAFHLLQDAPRPLPKPLDISEFV